YHTFAVDGFANPVSVGPSIAAINFTAKAPFTISATSGENGSISPYGVVFVKHAGSQKFDFSPKFGYEVDRAVVNGVNEGSVTTFTVTNVTSNQTIEVFFKPKVLTITASAGPNGSISPSGSVEVPFGQSQLFTFTPDAGYVVDRVLVNGNNVGSGSTYLFT